MYLKYIIYIHRFPSEPLHCPIAGLVIIPRVSSAIMAYRKLSQDAGYNIFSKNVFHSINQ